MTWRSARSLRGCVPNQYHAKITSLLLIDVLNGVSHLEVHVAVNRDEMAPVFSGAPFESDEDRLANSS